MILNLGCGSRPMESAVNHDKIKHSNWVDIAHDLNIYPWPFQNCEFETIYMIDVLEHLVDVVKSLEECHRILRHGGLLHLEVPFAGDLRGFRDPTHIHWFTEGSFDYFIHGSYWEEHYGFYSKMRWVKKEYHTSPEGDNLYWILEKPLCN